MSVEFYIRDVEYTEDYETGRFPLSFSNDNARAVLRAAGLSYDEGALYGDAALRGLELTLDLALDPDSDLLRYERPARVEGRGEGALGASLWDAGLYEHGLRTRLESLRDLVREALALPAPPDGRALIWS